MAENKVQFNLKNVHYAPLTDEAKHTWGTPVHVPGSVAIALEAQGEVSKFYADGIVYYQSSSNNGYDGDLEMSLIPDQMLQDIWGMAKVTTDNVVVENANDQAKSFALLFQIDGDAANRFFALYNCKATRPNVESKTNEDTKTPQTQKIKISAAPMQDGNIKAHTCTDTAEMVKQNWFKNVYYHEAGK